MKTYSLCGRRTDKKAFKEKKIYGVIAIKWILVYLKVLFAEPKNELNILYSISCLHYELQKK